MGKNTDSWCDPVRSRKGNVVSGGAARNIRIAGMGGMDEIVDLVAKNTLKLANAKALSRNLATGAFGRGDQGGGIPRLN
jgi:hypothetical protein